MNRVESPLFPLAVRDGCEETVSPAAAALRAAHQICFLAQSQKADSEPSSLYTYLFISV